MNKNEGLRDYVFNNPMAKIRISIKQADEQVKKETLRQKLEGK